jgi:uncharacterized protein YjbI with pentapeptide repeats
MPTIDCVPLTIAYLAIEYFAIQPPTLYDYYWSVTDSKAQEVWSLAHNYTNTSTSNLTEHALCLPPGSYTFGSVANVPYILSSRDGKFKCGFGPSINYTFTLSKESNGNEGFLESGCAHEELDREIEIEPLQCYFKAIADSKDYWSVDYNAWFGDEICGPLLADACSSRKPIGFNDLTTTPDIEGFCVYHHCAYPAYLSDDDDEAFYGCQCQLPIIDQSRWDDLDDDETPVWLSNSENYECCQNKTEESNLLTSCSCYIIPLCEDGDMEMCLVAEEHCCAEDSDQEECKRYFLHIVCQESVIPKCEEEDLDTCATAVDTFCCTDGDEECKRNFVCDKSVMPKCEEGDLDMCATAVDTCCTDGDGATQDNCKQNYLKAGCDRAILVDVNKIIPPNDCCIDGDDECIQYYSSVACDRSLQQEEFIKDQNTTESCINAAEAYCGNETEYEYELSCYCSFYETLCSKYPGEVCSKAAYSCCGTSYVCHCDLYSWAVSLGWEEGQDKKDNWCSEAAKDYALQPEEEEASLRDFYNQTNGDNWINNTGWGDYETTSYCDWFGVSCNDNGQVSALVLGSNNLSGPIDPFPELLDLEMLDLANNELSGIMGDFYLFQKLVHIDLSYNNLSGEIDALLSPSIEHADFSYNKFNRIDTFKLFKSSYRTLRMCDLSHNSIDQAADEIFVNVPPNLKELILSDNKIRGTFPSPLELLPDVKVFRAENNELSGPIPDFVRSFARLKELNLSNQKLSGSIPEGLSNLLELSVLDWQ